MKLKHIIRTKTLENIHCFYCKKCTLEADYYKTKNNIYMHNKCYRLYKKNGGENL